MHNGAFSVMLIHTISFMTHTSPKVFLVIAQMETSNVSKSGEDYRIGSYFSTVHGYDGQYGYANLALEQCGHDCLKCVQGSYGLGMTKFTCEQKATPPPPPTTTAKPIATSTTGENCARTPRNNPRNLKAAERLRKRNRQRNKNMKPWGVWVENGREFVEGFLFCCIRGPRTPLPRR